MTSSWHTLTRLQCNELYAKMLTDRNVAALRTLCTHDRFFLLTIACKRQDANNDWVYARCREVEAKPDGYLDLWFREGYKSTIITFAGCIEEILSNPEITIGIFSHTRPIAKAFLKQIKIELETNTFLQQLFPDILYANPDRESSSWSLDNGITVKRQSNPNANTVEAWGLVDGQPTSKHYGLLVFDDIVVRESVTTPDQIVKTTEALELAYNLGQRDGKRRYAGTTYHFKDTYATMIARGAVKVRRYPATKDGTPTGEPVFITRKQIDDKRREMGPYTFSAQMLLNPLADEAQGFKAEWLNYYDGMLDTKQMNVYLLVDPANAKKKHNDYTVMLVLGLSFDGNTYLLDGVRDRLNLTQRTAKLFHFHRKYRPLKTGYEQYGMQADIQHIQYVQAQEQYRFAIVELGGSIPKPDRIRGLIPFFEQGRLWLPRKLLYLDSEGKIRNLTREFVDDSYLIFPLGDFDDDLDCMSRICDPLLAATHPLGGGRGERRNDEEGRPRKPALTNHEYAVLP